MFSGGRSRVLPSVIFQQSAATWKIKVLSAISEEQSIAFELPYVSETQLSACSERLWLCVSRYRFQMSPPLRFCRDQSPSSPPLGCFDASLFFPVLKVKVAATLVVFYAFFGYFFAVNRSSMRLKVKITTRISSCWLGVKPQSPCEGLMDIGPLEVPLHLYFPTRRYCTDLKWRLFCFSFNLYCYTLPFLLQLASNNCQGAMFIYGGHDGLEV